MRQARRLDGDLATRVVVVGVVVLATSLGGVATAGAFEEPVERNVEYRDDLASVYEPFTEQSYPDGLVFTPTPYGDWLNHPFQWLRTDPSFESGPTFVLDRDAPGDFASLEGFPGRQLYRFTYRGEWPPRGDGVRPVVEPLSVRSGDRVTVSTRTGIVVGAESATIRIAADGEAIQYGVRSLDGEDVVVDWTLSPDGAFVRGENVRRYGDETSVPLVGASTVSMSLTYVQPGGSTVTYRQEIDVASREGVVRVLWPPESRVCRLTADCGTAGTYLEGGDYPTGVSLSSNVTVGG